MTKDNYIKIYLENCVVQLPVGLYDSEKGNTQPVEVSIEAFCHQGQFFADLQAKDISATIDYAQLYKYVTEILPTLPHVPLLESLAEHIASFCFQDARVDEVTVRLRKTNIFKDCVKVGIELHRKRGAA